MTEKTLRTKNTKAGKVIAVIGAPGVGKSFLVKQLASLNCKPAFFEGEAGIFTKDALAKINARKDSAERYNWLLDRYKNNLSCARKIACELGINCYVDGDVISVEAWLGAEIGNKSPIILRRWIKNNRSLMADKVILLTASLGEIEKRRNLRARESEMNDFIRERALRIQKSCLELAKNYSHMVIVNRTGMEFTRERDLNKIITVLGKNMLLVN